MAVSFLTTCNNFFHDLVPPDENQILSFTVDGQTEREVILTSEIYVMVEAGTSVNALIPNIEISSRATLIPLTMDYLSDAFPSANIMQAAIGIFTADDLSSYVLDLIADNRDFNRPIIDKPIDFSGPVNFIVISARGNIRQYTVNIVIDSGLPRLINFGFSKFDNEEIIKDAVSFVNENTRTIQAAVLYPAEMDLTYALIPSFTILGDKVEVDGAEVQSGIDAIQFNNTTGIQTKTIIVWRNEIPLDFTLTIVFSLDPDSIRSITDFRFNRTDNPSPGIAANAVGSIINNDELGTIHVQVFYTGIKPSYLTPRFTAPGNVTVNNVTQTSGVNSHDFSSSIEYRVISRNNLYVRTYTVTVDFIDIAASSPVISAFKFSSALNPSLVQDTTAQISETSGIIMIIASYGSVITPDTLIPEFSATGIVTVNNSVQTSGFSAQNFSRQIKYSVTSPENPTLTRDYWVQVSFTRDTSLDATITAFSFHPGENAGLQEELTGRIDHNAGKITIIAPVGSGVSARTMYPRFTSAGQVRVNGTLQTSGVNGHIFNSPIEYHVTSANGTNTKIYTVTVRELQSRIFVNQNAVGMGDGTSWHDAFRELSAACAAAELFDEDVPKEIWIAAGTYRPSRTGNREEYFLITPNTSYIGGFAGNETTKDQRNTAVNKTIISGDLGGGVRSWNLFGRFNTANVRQQINGDVSFEGMEFTSANASTASGDRRSIFDFYFSSSVARHLDIISCTFKEMQMGNLEVIRVTGSSRASMRLSNVTMSDIDGGSVVFQSNGRAIIENSAFDSCRGPILLGGVLSHKEITNTNITNVPAGHGLTVYVSGGNVIIDNVTIDGVQNGNGISISAGTAIISNSNIRNSSINTNGGGIRIDVSINAVVNNTIIENVRAENGGGISASSTNNPMIEGHLTISNSTIRNAIATNNGGGVHFNSTGRLVIENSLFENCRADESGGAVFSNVQASGMTININDTHFVNCISRNNNYGKILRFNWSVNPVIRNCTFTHTEDFLDIGVGDFSGMFWLSGWYENCTFNMLNTNTTVDNYIFGNYLQNIVSVMTTTLTLKDCVFNFKNSGRLGLVSMSGPNDISGYNYYLMLDNVTINNYNGLQPLIRLQYNNSNISYNFRTNNLYNETPLNNQAAINSLVSNGIIRLEFGAVINLLP